MVCLDNIFGDLNGFERSEYCRKYCIIVILCRCNFLGIVLNN